MEGLAPRSSSRLPRVSGLSATIAERSGSPAMSKHSKRSIEQYYAEYPEHERLSSARGQLEFERTKRIVQRFLPSPPAIVCRCWRRYWPILILARLPRLRNSSD